MTLALGFLDIVRGLTGDISDAPHPDIQFIETHLSKSLIIALGLVLIYVSDKLFNRKRMAWMLATIATAASLALHVVHRDVQLSLAMQVVILALLVWSRPEFKVRSEPRSIKHGFALFALNLFVALAYGTAGFWLMDKKDFGIDFQLQDAIGRTLNEFLLFGNPDLTPHTSHARWFLQSLKFAGVTSCAIALFSLFRPLAFRLTTHPQEQARAGQLVEKYGRSSMDFYKLFPDKYFFFSNSPEGFIAYRVANGVAVALADPVGATQSIRELITAFKNYCNDCGWLVCFLQAEPECRDIYRDLGLKIVKIGEEARINLEKFCTTTIKKKDFKGKANKFKDYAFKRYETPHSQELLDRVEAVSDEWLSLPGRGEHGFTLGKFERNYIAATPLFTLEDKDGNIIAFVNEAKSYFPGEISIDLMRHKTEVPSGTMDFLFLKLLTYYQEHGYKYFNLGLAALAGVGESPDASLQERALHQLYEHLNKYFSYKGLRNYKQKFEPEWESRYFIYEAGPRALVKSVLAFRKVTEY